MMLLSVSNQISKVSISFILKMSRRSSIVTFDFIIYIHNVPWLLLSEVFAVQ